MEKLNYDEISAKQQRRVLEYLEGNKTITQNQASINLSVMRLPVVIFRLRDKGYNIKTNMIERANQFGEVTRFAEYSLEEPLTL